ncbi:unnamed protein product, partial [Tuber aestivum]
TTAGLHTSSLTLYPPSCPSVPSLLLPLSPPSFPTATFLPTISSNTLATSILCKHFPSAHLHLPNQTSPPPEITSCGAHPGTKTFETNAVCPRQNPSITQLCGYLETRPSTWIRALGGVCARKVGHG